MKDLKISDEFIDTLTYDNLRISSIDSNIKEIGLIRTRHDPMYGPELSFELMSFEGIKIAIDNGLYKPLTSLVDDSCGKFNHRYEKYVGFTDIYDFCTKCGDKRWR